MEKKRIIVLGGGYGGIACCKQLIKKIRRSEAVEIVLIDKNPRHTLMTQLHETACARTPSYATIIPYEEIFKKVKNAEFHFVRDEVINLDLDKRVLKSENHTYSFDYLAVATGSRPTFFGVEGAREYAHKLWSFKEAVIIREMVEDNFRMAARGGDGTGVRRLLTFGVAGGGFTGVELCGDLAEYCKYLCQKYDIDRSEVRILLIEAAEDILNTLSPGARRACSKYLNKLGVEILLNAGIARVEQSAFHLKDGRSFEGTLLWSAGIKGNPQLKDSGADMDKKGRITVDENLRSLSHDNVFCIGDSIGSEDPERVFPQVVENARQSGKLCANNILSTIRGGSLKKYKPRFHGSMISVGPVYGVAKVGIFGFRFVFATGIKHLVNLHYHFTLGGMELAIKYMEWESEIWFGHGLFGSARDLTKQKTTYFEN